MKRNLLASLCIGAMMLPAVPSLYAQTLGSMRTTYNFPRHATPDGIESYSTVAFGVDPWSVTSMRGDKLLESKKIIENFAVSPAGNTFVAVLRDKKGHTELEVYSTESAQTKKFKFDTKLYGEPECAAYASDARKIFVVTNLGLFEFDSNKFRLVGRYNLDFKPWSMTVSGNGYYLLMLQGDKVGLYNAEDHTMRRVFEMGEMATAARFTADSSAFGILTSDGVLDVYDTRTLALRTQVDDLGEGIDFDFNDTGKYAAVATAPDVLVVVNLLRHSEREEHTVAGKLQALRFLKDSRGNTLVAYTAPFAIGAERLLNLEPYFGRLVADGAEQKMAEWMKMLPGESLEAYNVRVNDETRARQRRLFEDELSTEYAGNLLEMASVSLGSYDRAKEVLQVNFDNMPTIFLPVPSADVTSISTASDLAISDQRYGLLPDDNFELVYAKFHNKNTGNTYVYDNVDRVAMNFMENDDNVVSLDILRQQQMEEIKLQEIREKVVAEAKSDNVISDHTQITVDSKVVPDYNANGDKILNYVVKFTYQVDPEFSATEDFKPGKYHVEDSGAASSMLKIVKEAFEGEFGQYLTEGGKMNVNITGTADATPIVRTIIYDGAFGDYPAEPVYQNGTLGTISIENGGRVASNEQLAFLRAAGVRSHLEKNLPAFADLDKKYQYHINVSEGKGSEFRRITAEFILVDAFK